MYIQCNRGYSESRKRKGSGIRHRWTAKGLRRQSPAWSGVKAIQALQNDHAPSRRRASKTPVFRRAIAASPFGLLAMTDKGARLGRCDRPRNPPQRPEKVESAPGIATAAAVAARSGGLRGATRRGALRSEGEALPLAASPGDSRPENPPQHLEKVDSAPGIATAAAVAARSGRLRGATRQAAPRSEGGALPLAASPGDNRPENPPQRLERLIPRPGSRQPTAVAVRSGGLRDATRQARLDPRAERLRWPPRQPTIARKIRRNTLKRLNSAPGIATAAAVAARSGSLRDATRRAPLNPRVKRFRSPPRQATIAKKCVIPKTSCATPLHHTSGGSPPPYRYRCTREEKRRRRSSLARQRGAGAPPSPGLIPGDGGGGAGRRAQPWLSVVIGLNAKSPARRAHAPAHAGALRSGRMA